MSREILWFDCETGGVDSEKDALLQLSAIVEIDGKEVDSIDLKMKPLPGKTVSQKALDVQGRSMDDINGFHDAVLCFHQFRGFLSRRPASKNNRYIMGGYNADLDCRFLSQWYKDLTGGPYAYWDYLQFSPIDVLPILRTMRHYGMIQTVDTRLETMCNFFGIEIQAHDSMSDIRATMELSNIIIERIKNGFMVAF